MSCCSETDVEEFERAVLAIVLELHPDHLTPTELALEVATDRAQLEAEAVEHAIRDLGGSGLLRCIGDVVAPTHAALRADALLT